MLDGLDEPTEGGGAVRRRAETQRLPPGKRRGSAGKRRARPYEPPSIHHRGGASSFGGAGLTRREPAGESPREPEEGRRDGDRHDDDDDNIDDADFGGDGRDIDFGEGGTEDVRDNRDGAAREDAAAGASGDDATDRVDVKGYGDAGEELGKLTTSRSR